MATRRLYLGLDVSTTAVKAVLIDGVGAIVATASTSHSVETPHPLWSEQDPEVERDGRERARSARSGEG